ncbi:MAG TPA: hypothetical protein VGL39_28200 [Jatrophihabitantaceae bacterium]|jgi:hypothetical protein
MVQSVLVGAATALGLFMLYSAAAHRWPDSYFSGGPSVDPVVSRKLGKYALFRLGPVFLAAAFAAVTADRLDSPVWLAALSLGAIHVSHTSGFAIARIVRRRQVRHRMTALVFNVILCSAIACVVVVATVTASFWRPLIPRPSDLSIAVWTGLFAGVMAVWVSRLTFRPGDLPALVARVRQEVGPALVSYARDRAQSVGSDPQFVEALLIAEAMNRPKWMRRLEEKKARFIPRGSYGVMQVQSNSLLTDEQSIDLAVRPYAGVSVRNVNGGVLRPVLHALTERHNPDPMFVDLVEQVFYILEPSYRSTKARAPDGRPQIEVEEIRRVGESLVVTGTAVVHDGRVLYRPAHDDKARWVSARVLPDGPTGLRGRFSIAVPVATEELLLSGEPISTGTDPTDRVLTVNCEYPDREMPSG